MCRRIVVACFWDDETELEDADQVFNPKTGYNSLTPSFERELLKLLNRFNGDITVQVMHLEGR